MQAQISNSNATCHPPRKSNAKCKCILKCKCRMQMQNQGKQLKAFSQILLWLETVLSGPVWLPSPTFSPLSFTLDALIEIEIFSFLLKGLIVFVPRSASSVYQFSQSLIPHRSDWINWIGFSIIWRFRVWALSCSCPFLFRLFVLFCYFLFSCCSLFSSFFVWWGVGLFRNNFVPTCPCPRAGQNYS